MIDRASIKQNAKEQIKGKIGILFVITLIISAISTVAAMIPFVGSIASLILTPAFALASTMIYLNITKGNTPSVGDAFAGFNDLWCAFKVQFLTGLFVCLWSLLFYIPGIIKAISYSMSMYILAENPGMPALEAIDRSKKMMNGHKMEYFLLSLSFIGWAFLAVFTFGILYIWLIPYMQTSFANFYNAIKNDGAVEVNAEPVEAIASENI